MEEAKKSSYNGYTDARKEANKRYMENFVEIKVRMKADKRTTVQEHAATMGESMNSFVVRAINETMERDTITPTESTGQSPAATADLLPPDTLKEAQNAAGRTGEAVQEFVTRAIKTQAKRDETTRRMGLDPVTGSKPGQDNEKE